jgi:hypothetical protein
VAWLFVNFARKAIMARIKLGTIDLDAGRLGLLDTYYTRNSMDTRAPVRHLSEERQWHCVTDAARSTSILGIHGSACAALVDMSAAVYGAVEHDDGTFTETVNN